jgi:hypothetical protein
MKLFYDSSKRFLKHIFCLVVISFLCVCGLFVSPFPVYAAQTNHLSIWSTQSIPPAKDAFTNDNDDPLPQPSWAFNISKLGTIFAYADIDMPLYTTLEVTLDILSIALMIICLIIIIKSAKEYGRSTLGIAMLYLLNATIVLGAIRLIFILIDDNFYTVHDISEMTYWHLLYYYAIILFFAAGNILSNLVTVTVTVKKSSYAKAVFYLVFSIILCISILIAIPYTDNFIVKNIQPTVFSSYGGFHILSILLAIPTAIYLYRIKIHNKGLGRIIGSIYIALIILATISGWELVNESWKWFLDSDQFGEIIERILWVPIFVYILRTYLNMRIKSVQKQDSLNQNSTGEDTSKAHVDLGT